jgi:hypothetical protein
MAERPQDKHRGIGAEPLLRPTYPWRARLFVGVSLAAYVAINVFWQYLSSGSWLEGVWPSLEVYRRALIAHLGEGFYHPLSILCQPWMILVSGLLLGVIMFVPVMVSVLYRLWVAGLFMLVTALVGHAPVLALTLALGGFLASCTPLRSNRPFVAVLLGLLPGGLYLCLASYVAGDTLAALPIQRWVLYAPFVVAAAAAMAAAATVLGLARLTGYRPGVLWPALAVLLAVPMSVFYWKIGAAELDYALIANPISYNSAIFQPAVVEVWSRHNRAEGLAGESLMNLARTDLDHRRADLLDQCDRFLARHGRSPRAPAVLWVKAQCHSLQLDGAAFHSGTIKYADSFVLPGSAQAWAQLEQRYGWSDQAAIAEWHLGELALGAGDPRQADQLLRSALRRLRSALAPPPTDQTGEKNQIFTPLQSLPGPAYYEQALFETDRLLWLMDANDVLYDPKAAAAMAAFTRLNPFDDEFGKDLQALLDEPGTMQTTFGRNIELAAAKANPDRQAKVRQLTRLAEDPGDSDAAIEANFELGRLAMQPAVAGPIKLKPAGVYFQYVLDHQPNPWRQQAAKWMGRPTR